VRVLVVVALLAACGGDLDPPWQLDHDRIVAVRATPPAIVSGERAQLDGLIALAGSSTVEQPPEVAMVISPESLASALAFEGGAWVVTAPDEAALAAARTELGLEAGAPVPLQLGVAYANQSLIGLKSILLGTSAANPTMPTPLIDGAPAPPPGTELVVGSLVDVPLSIEVLETDEVNWLTSCGEMHDFDLPSAYLRVEVDSPTEGELAVVLRDDRGGVTWQVWPIRATSDTRRAARVPRW
jgi:hypothetical protein